MRLFIFGNLFSPIILWDKGQIQFIFQFDKLDAADITGNRRQPLLFRTIISSLYTISSLASENNNFAVQFTGIRLAANGNASNETNDREHSRNRLSLLPDAYYRPFGMGSGTLLLSLHQQEIKPSSVAFGCFRRYGRPPRPPAGIPSRRSTSVQGPDSCTGMVSIRHSGL